MYIIRQYRYGVFLYEIYLDQAKKQGYCNTIFFSHCFLCKKKKIVLPVIENALYRTLSSIKEKFIRPPFINAVKLPIAV
jgi:hypothetical protein